MGGIAAIVMAAGKGTRMKSKLPKVLHQISGKPLVTHVIQAVQEAGIDDISVIVGHGREQVEGSLGSGFKYAYQAEQLGTGHAVLQAKDIVDHDKTVLVVSGDTPLVSADTLDALVKCHQEGQAVVTVLTAIVADPTGYGRIIRNNSDFVQGIIEEKDASPDEKVVKEINTGTYCFNGKFLFETLQGLKPDNAQQEYYLTDVVALAVKAGHKVLTQICEDPQELQGINSRSQLAEVGQLMNQKIVQQLMAEGVTIVDPSSTYIDATVRVARDTIIWPFTFLHGQTTIGENCEIGPHCRLTNTKVGNGVTIESSVLKDAVIGNDCLIGPFAYLRPGTVLADRVKVGDFVEIKKSYIGEGSKVPHLSYVGDATVGKNVNIGAGTITCNYDGTNKFTTEIGDDAFIGSNTNLVAPIQVGQGAVVAAGSTLTKDVPERCLGVGRSKQVNIDHWVSRRKQK